MDSPVPADIDIANSVEPLHIAEIAKELNLSPTHYDLYGKYKAKVILIQITFFTPFLDCPFPFLSLEFLIESVSGIVLVG